MGREEEKLQEEIISEVFNRIAERKGERFQMNLIKGGGKGGLSKEIIVGNNINGTPILPIEMFQEIKKSLNMSKTKMEEMCHIMRKFQVKMTPNVREKL